MGGGWSGVGAPANTPNEIIDLLNREVNAALADPMIKGRLENMGSPVLMMSPAEFRKLIEVHESIQLGGRTIAINYTDPADFNIFDVSISGLTFKVGDFVTIEGDVTFGKKVLTEFGPTQVDVFAGDNLGVFLGQGPAHLSNGDINPLATGVLLTAGRVGLIQRRRRQVRARRAGQRKPDRRPRRPDQRPGHGPDEHHRRGGRRDAADPRQLRPRHRAQAAGFDDAAGVPGPRRHSSRCSARRCSGDFAFSQSPTGEVTIAATGVGLSLGGGAVGITGASGALVIGAAGLRGPRFAARSR